MFIHLKYTTINDHIDDRNISREISSQIQLAVGHASLGGRLGNFIFSHQNRLRQWALRSNCTFYITFQSCTSMHPRNFKFGGALSSLKCKKPHYLVASRTWKVLYLDTKTESEDDFDVHDCEFEVAFDAWSQLYIQGCIFIIQLKSCLRAHTGQNTAPAVASHQKRPWGWQDYAQTCN